MAICPLYNARERKCPLDGDTSVKPCENYKGRCEVIVKAHEQSPEKLRNLLVRAGKLDLEGDLGLHVEGE